MTTSPDFEKFDKIAGINFEYHGKTLPILIASRDEEQHILSLINGIVDKALDLGKLLIGISFPALVTLYSFKGDNLNTKTYLILTAILLVVGILVFCIGIAYKLSRLSIYLGASTARLKNYTAMLTTFYLKSKNEDLKLEYAEIVKKNSRP